MHTTVFPLPGRSRRNSFVCGAAGLALFTLLHLGLAMNADAQSKTNAAPAKTQLATFGSGCFWCTEAVFETLPGVKSAVSGYAGGQVPNPTYKQVCSGDTGHAEVIQIEFDPATVSYEKLLDLFWKSHDPTTLNRQGADVGTQYRSVIFYHDEAQKKAAEKSKANAQLRFSSPIVTEISPAPQFYPAEEYHQDFFRRNPHHPYCTAVIQTKLQKLQKP